MIFCLVRTDPSAKKQQGISFLLIDLNSPGVEIRPIRTLDGAHEVNEVFLSDVRVPVANLVGTENRGGWDCAKFLLTHERTTAARVSNAIAELRRVKESAARLSATDAAWPRIRSSRPGWPGSRSRSPTCRPPV